MWCQHPTPHTWGFSWISSNTSTSNCMCILWIPCRSKRIQKEIRVVRASELFVNNQMTFRCYSAYSPALNWECPGQFLLKRCSLKQGKARKHLSHLSSLISVSSFLEFMHIASQFAQPGYDSHDSPSSTVAERPDMTSIPENVYFQLSDAPGYWIHGYNMCVVRNISDNQSRESDLKLTL